MYIYIYIYAYSYFSILVYHICCGPHSLTSDAFSWGSGGNPPLGYGVVTMQLSNAPGLEASIHGKWRAVNAPEGAAVLLAGDARRDSAQ